VGQSDHLFMGFRETGRDAVHAEVLRTIRGSSGPMLVVRMSPPIIGQQFGLGGRDLEVVILAPRLEGYTIIPITKWPTPVYVVLPLVDWANLDVLGDADYRLIMWAELYPTMKDAEEASRLGRHAE